jgi:SPP1 family predicted phage head-tail adaptor
MITGKLRKRLQFQSLSTTPDASGQPQNTWTTYYTCWGSVDYHKGQLFYDIAEFVGQSFYTIKIRFPWGITISPNDRVVWTQTGGASSSGSPVVFSVQAIINPEMRNRELTVLAYVINEAD